MKRDFPNMYADERGRLAVAIVFFLMLQALAMGIGAFATRTVFAGLHADITENLYRTLALLAGAGFLAATARVIANALSERLGQSFAISFRERFYNHLSALPKSEVERKRVGALALRFTGDLSAMSQWVSGGFTGITSAILTTTVAMFVLWRLSPIYGVIGVIAVGVCLCLMALVGWRLPETIRKMRYFRAKMAIHMMERVGRAPYMRVLGRVKKDQARLVKQGENLSDNAIARTRRIEIMRSMPDVCMSLAAGAFLLLSATQHLGPGIAAAGLAVLGIVTASLRNLSNVWNYYCSWRVAREKALAIFNKPTIDIGTGTQEKLPRGPLSVEVCGKVIDNKTHFDWTIEANAHGVLLGREIDVSRLMNVIAGLEPVSDGYVRLGGVRLQDINPSGLQRRTHYVSEHSPILQGSLRRAVTTGCARRPSDTVINEVIRTYGLSYLAQRIGGLSGRVVENGRNLTLQERYRLLFARITLAKPSIILIDLTIANFNEFTASVATDCIRSTSATCVFSEGSKNLSDPDRRSEYRTLQTLATNAIFESSYLENSKCDAYVANS